MSRIFIFLFLFGCGATAAPTRTSESVAVVAAPAADPDLGCVFDANAKRTCDSRGGGFTYGPRPYIYCRGIPPQRGEQEAERARIRESACECNDDAALAERRRMCSMVP